MIQSGIYALKDDDYHRGDPWINALSSTFLKNVISKSPGHAIHELNNPKQADFYDFGNSFHYLMTEPDEFDQNVAVFDGRRYGGKWESFKAAAGKKLILKPDDIDRLHAMKEAAFEMKTVAGLFADGIAEQSYFWLDEVSGIMCKCRPDWECGDVAILADIKTEGRLAKKSAFSRTISNLHYDLSAAYYMGGVNSVLMAQGSEQLFSKWLWIVVETEPPHGVGIYEADQIMMDNGRTKVRYALDKCAECFKSDIWPKYPDEVVPVSLPNYGLWWQKELE